MDDGGEKFERVFDFDAEVYRALWLEVHDVDDAAVALAAYDAGGVDRAHFLEGGDLFEVLFFPVDVFGEVEFGDGSFREVRKV